MLRHICHTLLDLLSMARVITTLTRKKQLAVKPLLQSLPFSTASRPRPTIRLEHVICDSGVEAVPGVIGSGWVQIGLFSWEENLYRVPSYGSRGVYLKGSVTFTVDGLTTHVRLVDRDTLIEIPNSSLVFPDDIVDFVETEAVQLTDGSTYMIQADCLGSADVAAFARVQVVAVVRQVY